MVGETPYAETAGDSLNLTIAEPGPSTILNVCGNVKCVVVTVSGRPVVIEPYESQIDALVAAWLPGTEDQGVADVLFGDYGFNVKLPRTWFKTVDQLPMNVVTLITIPSSPMILDSLLSLSMLARKSAFEEQLVSACHVMLQDT